MYPSFCLPVWVNNWHLFHSLNIFFPALCLLFVLKRQQNCIMLLHLNNMLNRHRTQEGLRTQLLVILLPKNHIKLTAGHYLESKIELQCRCWTRQKWIQYVWDEIHCGEKVLSDVWYGSSGEGAKPQLRSDMVLRLNYDRDTQWHSPLSLVMFRKYRGPERRRQLSAIAYISICFYHCEDFHKHFPAPYPYCNYKLNLILTSMFK